MANGLLSIRKKDRNKAIRTVVDDKPSSFKRFMRGRNYTGENESIIVEEARRKSIAPFERALRQYRYSDALDDVFTKANTDPSIILAILKEIEHRAGLRRALQHRQDVQLIPLLEWMSKYLSDPRFSPTIIRIMTFLVDLYGVSLHQSPLLSQHMDKMQRALHRQLATCREATAIMGQVEMLL
jgi:U3 small nucleolar RNA-associated protein 15